MHLNAVEREGGREREREREGGREREREIKRDTVKCSAIPHSLPSSFKGYSFTFLIPDCVVAV